VWNKSIIGRQTMATMMNPERRQAPRVTVEKLTYITLEPGNGGMLLNVSEGGLCFRAAVAVQKTGNIHFCLSEPNLRIEADGQLAWSDETQKKGGLRFTNLSSEARKQIRHWINQPAMLVTAERRSERRSVATPHRSPDESLVASSSRPTSTNPVAATVARQPSAKPEALSLKIRAGRLLRGFSGGLATGLLVSSLCGAGFLFYAHREQFGESLIHWGERLGARSQLTNVPADSNGGSRNATPINPRSNEVHTAAASLPPSAAVPEPNPVSRREEHQADPVAQPRPAPSKSERLKFAAASPLRSAAISPPDRTSSSLLPSDLFPATPIAPTANLGENTLAPPPPRTGDSGNRIEVSKDTGADVAPEKYLEVGKFKEKGMADQTTDRLAQFGFPAIVSQRGHLWLSSYYILVGPYGNDREITAAHKSLASRGFKTRPFEKGSRAFTLRLGLTVTGTPIPFGDYTISWESYSSDAVIKFEKNRNLVLTTEGRLIRHPFWHDRNAYVYKRNADGSRTLLEIRFAGTNQTLVLGKH
jgi:PilZ domain